MEYDSAEERFNKKLLPSNDLEVYVKNDLGITIRTLKIKFFNGSSYFDDENLKEFLIKDIEEYKEVTFSNITITKNIKFTIVCCTRKHCYDLITSFRKLPIRKYIVNEKLEGLYIPEISIHLKYNKENKIKAKIEYDVLLKDDE